MLFQIGLHKVNNDVVSFIRTVSCMMFNLFQIYIKESILLNHYIVEDGTYHTQAFLQQKLRHSNSNSLNNIYYRFTLL